MKILRTLILLVGVVAGISLVWRWLSRRQQLPCPTWLSWLVEGQLVDTIMGTQSTLDRLGLRPGQRVLEVGPGPGRLLIPAARRVLPGGEVVGLDIQEGMLNKLKARTAQAGVSNLTPMLGDITQSSLPPESFDVIYFCTVLGEVPDREAALRQSYRALKPGGRLSITEMVPDPHYQPQETVKQLAESVGFHPEATYGSWYLYTSNFVK